MEKVAVQMYDEPDTNGDRKMIAPITTTDEVIVNPSSDNAITLTEKLKQIKPLTISKSQPGFSCLWGKIL